MDKNGKKEDAGGIIPKAPNKFNKIFNKIIIPQPNPITMPSSFFCLIEAPKINITSAAKSNNNDSGNTSIAIENIRKNVITIKLR